jgi:hypothetical protein
MTKALTAVLQDCTPKGVDMDHMKKNLRGAHEIKPCQEVMTSVVPSDDAWGALFQGLDQFEPSFKMKREQPKSQQKRSPLLE